MTKTISKIIRRRHKIAAKAGMAPGTIAYVGSERDFKVTAETFYYNESELIHKENLNPLLIKDEITSNQVKWINIVGIHDTEIVAYIGKTFCLHSLVMEDIAHAEQRPKIDDYGDFIYLAVKMIDYNENSKEVTSEQLSIIYKDNTIITFIEDKGDLFDGLRDRLKKGNIKIRKSSADYLLYSMLDIIVDNYFLVLEKIGDKLEEVEIRLLGTPMKEDVNALHGLKRELIYIRKTIWPMRDVIGFITKTDHKNVLPNTQLYLRDVYDHCVQAIDTVETFRDLTSGLMDLYLSSLSNKMNLVMKTLTVISTIFIPLTFIVGVYGMNFDFMPELHEVYAYPIVWMIMLGITVGMLIYFKKKEWF
jgi:magnesium transporter